MGARALIVYGDHARIESMPGALAAGVRARLAAARAAPPGLARHAALAGAFVAAAELAQAVADRAFAARGADGPDADADRALAALLPLARALAVSWRSRFRRTPVPPYAPVLAGGPVAPRTAEGYALYAVYPEAYAAAARGARADAALGLRSIGTGLAAAAAAGARVGRVATARPVGHPFARDLRLAPELSAALRGRVLVVDEGPGLSGSSLAAGAAAVGEPVLMTSHGGAPGPMADDLARARWARAERVVADFDEHVLPRLPGWVGAVAGGPPRNWRDVSGGAWLGGRDLPADPPRERRKFRADTPAGPVLARFAGLGAAGELKLARARALTGFVPEPLGLAHGFLVERWLPGGPARPDLPRVADYLAARARLGGGPGASPAALLDMARSNVAERLGPELAARVPAPPPGPGRAAAIDGRLHWWEWVAGPDGRAWKTDALDHALGHDLVGHQDLAWDVAGAECELGLDAAALAAALAARGVAVDPALVAFHRVAYAAFQLGLWTLAGGAEADRYARRLAMLLTAPPPAAAGR